MRGLDGPRSRQAPTRAFGARGSARGRYDSRPVQTLRRTALYERHAALGARLVPFAGWEMPLQYTSIAEEHRAVRTSAGVFDVSHMGQLEIRGGGAHEYLQARLSTISIESTLARRSTPC